MSQFQIQEFLAELESHCYTSAIATFTNSEKQHFAIDLHRSGNEVNYGYKIGAKELFIAKIFSDCNPCGSLVLRSFTAEIDPLTNFPIKELRGYILTYNNRNFEFEKISPTIMFACQNTDAKTGEPLPFEQSVKYC
jgi:hypothetical protein